MRSRGQIEHMLAPLPTWRSGLTPAKQGLYDHAPLGISPLHGVDERG